LWGSTRYGLQVHPYALQLEQDPRPRLKIGEHELMLGLRRRHGASSGRGPVRAWSPTNARRLQLVALNAGGNFKTHVTLTYQGKTTRVSLTASGIFGLSSGARQVFTGFCVVSDRSWATACGSRNFERVGSSTPHPLYGSGHASEGHGSLGPCERAAWGRAPSKARRCCPGRAA